MNVVTHVAASEPEGADAQLRPQPTGVFGTATHAVRAAARFAYDLLNDLF
jgi:hypothetical protein